MSKMFEQFPQCDVDRVLSLFSQHADIQSDKLIGALVSSAIAHPEKVSEQFITFLFGMNRLMDFLYKNALEMERSARG